MEGNTARGASSPAKPALHIPDPLSTTRAAISSSIFCTGRRGESSATCDATAHGHIWHSSAQRWSCHCTSQTLGGATCRPEMRNKGSLYLGGIGHVHIWQKRGQLRTGPRSRPAVVKRQVTYNRPLPPNLFSTDRHIINTKKKLHSISPEVN